MVTLNETRFWHVYPLSACGARIHGEHDPGDRLNALIPWLGAAADLGCNALLLGPIFASEAHGYDTLDHFAIDPRLGDDAVFDDLVEACSHHGLDVWLDGVFNHVGVCHPFVAGGGPIRRDESGEPIGWEGDGTLALLDHSDPRTEDLVVYVMTHWLARGIAGWRLDVAYAVPPEFWARVLTRVREQFPEARFLGEMIHGDYTAFAEASTIDTITQYELWKAIWSSLASTNFWELDHALGRHAGFQQHRPMNTFIGNHDVDRIASTVGADKARLAAVALLTLPGIPSVYYGDERGAIGTKGEGEGADLPLRPPLDELPAENEVTELYRELLALRAAHPWIATGELRVVEKSNEKITFAVTNPEGPGEVVTHLSLVDGAHAYVHVDGNQYLGG